MPEIVDVQSLYKERGEQLFEHLYRQEREGFIRWSRRTFGCEEDEAVEVFQKSMIALYEKIDSGQLKNLSSSLKTYLYAIGRNLLLKSFRHQDRVKLMGDDWPEMEVEMAHLELEMTKEERQLKVAMNKLQAGCRKLLDMFYYHNFSFEAIADEMDYNTLDVVRTKKYKCLRQLRKFISNLPML